MPGGASLDQMRRQAYIVGMLRRYHAPGTTMSTYYGLGSTAPGVKQIVGNNGQYDIFDSTRSLAPMSAPGAPAQAINRKPYGSVPITVPRMYNSIGLEDNQLLGHRVSGEQFGPPTTRAGKVYMAQQVGYLKTRHQNNHEFMTAHMFRGGWKIAPSGNGSQTLNLQPATFATGVLNDTRIPADNLGNLGGLITTLWEDPSCDVIGFFTELNYLAAAKNGRKITEVWVNGHTFKPLYNNAGLQATGGSAYRIFDTLNLAREIGPNQKFPDTGITIVFRGMPEINFHIYNQGYQPPGTSESYDAQTDPTTYQRFIPNGQAIMTPKPGDWTGMVEGSEYAQYSLLEGSSRLVYGLGMGMERAIDPPRTDVKLLYNGAPVVLEPKTVYYATVGAP